MVYDYNIWTDDLTLDAWVYGPWEGEAEARDVATTYTRDHGVRPHITRYHTRTTADGFHETDTTMFERLTTTEDA
jgi:hypothetical protein